MKAFRTLTGIAAPVPIANIDTDMLLSARFLKTVSRSGLGAGLLHALRFDADDRERPDFVLNRPPWRDASILITLGNFGCGSSREHAPWALLDYGISCIIAPGFADIFYGNCFKNGILPVTLASADVDRLMAQASDPGKATMTVDLVSQTIVHHGGTLNFDIDPQRRARLLSGIDDIASAMAFEADIAGHETATRTASPWLADSRLARVI